MNTKFQRLKNLYITGSKNYEKLKTKFPNYLSEHKIFLSTFKEIKSILKIVLNRIENYLLITPLLFTKKSTRSNLVSKN